MYSVSAMTALIFSVLFLLPLEVDACLRAKEPPTAEEISKILMDSVDAENIRKNLHFLTEEMHVAGTDGMHRMSHKVEKIWKDVGLEDVHFIEYKVLLNYPEYDNPNRIFIRDAEGGVIFVSKGVAPAIITNEQDDPRAGVQWLAYSPAGSVAGDVIYVNYGRDEDFLALQELGISIAGKIALLRFGACGRQTKVYNAQRFGAIGALLYSEPADVAPEGTDPEHVYPNTVWMPREGAQRGTLMIGALDDPLSPLFPSKTNMYRSRTIEEARELRMLPSIPAMPLPYSDAYEILSRLGGQPAPSNFQGALNFTYNIGPGLLNGEQLSFVVNSVYDNRTIRNVVGYIHGAEEPDKFVIIGNHYDAWVYGAVDPNSGTAVLAEVVRVFVSTMKKTGWRPSRTIMFANWDAEEYGLIGSTEFCQEFADFLQQRAVIYINVDSITSNASLSVSAVPMLYDDIIASSKKIPNPSESEVKEGRMTVYNLTAKPIGRPKISGPASYSDHGPFIQFLGIPAIDMSYRDPKRSIRALYHSMYETKYLTDVLMDPTYAVSKAVAQLWVELTRLFADSPVIPLKPSVYGRVLRDEMFERLEEALGQLSGIDEALTQFESLLDTTEDFLNVSIAFEIKLRHATRKERTTLNERLMRVERCFVNPRGVGSNPGQRHVLYSLPGVDIYTAGELGVIYQQVKVLNGTASTEEERKTAARELANQINIVHYAVLCATNTLKDFI